MIRPVPAGVPEHYQERGKSCLFNAVFFIAMRFREATGMHLPALVRGMKRRKHSRGNARRAVTAHTCSLPADLDLTLLCQEQAEVRKNFICDECRGLPR
ncbi:MAG: hypothetical protein M0Q91_15585 [Methanoregula sp.]|nr:hypothetical protein [Methanoregula sp.]